MSTDGPSEPRAIWRDEKEKGGEVLGNALPLQTACVTWERRNSYQFSLYVTLANLQSVLNKGSP